MMMIMMMTRIVLELYNYDLLELYNYDEKRTVVTGIAMTGVIWR